MNRIRRRSLADQIGRLTALGVLVAILTLAGVGIPRVADDLYTATLRAQTTSQSPDNRDLIATVDATHASDSNDPNEFTIAPTWNSMPTNLRATRNAMPAAIRDVTSPARFVGVGIPPATLRTNIPGFPTTISPGGPPGAEVLTIEAYPWLQQDSTLAAGDWPTAPASSTAPIPVAISAKSAATLHWHIGEEKPIAGEGGANRTLVLVGTVKPRASDFWDMSVSRRDVWRHPNQDGEMQYGATVWVDPSAWTTLAPQLSGGQLVAWYPVLGDHLTLANVNSLQTGLAQFLANPRTIDDGTQDGKVLQLGSGLPNILQGFQGTLQTSSAVVITALIAALGVGALVLLATVRLIVGARRSVRDLLRSRGASVAGMVSTVCGELAVAAIPGAFVGALGAVLLAGTAPGLPTVGIRDAAIAATCAIAPIVAGAVIVAIGEGLPSGARALARRNLWAGEALLILIAAAAVSIAVTSGSGGDNGSSSGSPSEGLDPLVIATPLLVGLAAVVIVLRVYPLLVRGLGRILRGAGHASSFIGLRDGGRGGGTGWIVASTLTATATAVSTVTLLTSANHTAASSAAPGAPLLAPGTIPLVGIAVLVCVIAAASAFAVSTVSDAGRRGGRVRSLVALGFSRGGAARVALWDAVPAALVSVVIGGIAGLAAAGPVLGAVGNGLSARLSGGMAPSIGIAIAVLVLTLVIQGTATALDARRPARHDRRSS